MEVVLLLKEGGHETRNSSSTHVKAYMKLKPALISSHAMCTAQKDSAKPTEECLAMQHRMRS